MHEINALGSTLGWILGRLAPAYFLHPLEGTARRMAFLGLRDVAKPINRSKRHAALHIAL